LKLPDFCQSLNGTTAKYSVPAMAMPILDDIVARLPDWAEGWLFGETSRTGWIE